ncbi:MAG: hypothetical protein K2X74_00220, partial [Acetobacteraceae bacterium]|nr:hypothetical protein [Acetobacteraceae bacterium]
MRNTARSQGSHGGAGAATGGVARQVVALGMVALLGAACAPFNQGTYNVASAIADTGGRIGMPWGTMRPAMPEEATTIQRVALGAPPGSSLQSEPGDVWPGPLPPRATLANPDAALSGIPAYDPVGRRDPTAGLVPPPAVPPRSGPQAR